jgi:hypothetical protein
LKIVDEALLALNPAVGQFADLLRVESLPGLTVEVLVKRNHKERVSHVDEGIAHVAVVLQVDWQVEEVIAPCVRLIDPLEEHLLSVFVWNILDHYSRALVMSVDNVGDVKAEGCGLALGLETLRGDLESCLERSCFK